ncbi:YihY/virulence factor BrkB family protein [Hyphobacterium sp.]|uniref:YihY/virulence factor BrkB family protein n=1 Tax=Hyphobacterium sp. TaxID=2004662 RepID=UPI003BA9360D
MEQVRRIAGVVTQGFQLVISWPPLAVLIASVSRTMAREVMLFAGGVSFFTLLAIFPLVAVAVAIYGLVFDVSDAAAQIDRFASVIPESGRAFAERQIAPIAEAPRVSLSLQGLVALGISFFAASRGAKAVIAGLNQIGGVGDLRNVIKFNAVAMMTVVAGGALLVLVNIVVFSIPTIVRPIFDAMGLEFSGIDSFFNEWTAVLVTMIAALTLLYRFLMRRAGGIGWVASVTAAMVATLIWMLVSAGFSYYVSGWIRPTAYGSVGALIVFLLWIYWGAYAVFFGGALAVEVDKRRKGELAKTA